jgi:hypothetical protein
MLGRHPAPPSHQSRSDGGPCESRGESLVMGAKEERSVHPDPEDLGALGAPAEAGLHASHTVQHRAGE